MSADVLAKKHLLTQPGREVIITPINIYHNFSLYYLLSNIRIYTVALENQVTQGENQANLGNSFVI